MSSVSIGGTVADKLISLHVGKKKKTSQSLTIIFVASNVLSSILPKLICTCNTTQLRSQHSYFFVDTDMPFYSVSFFSSFKPLR